MCGQVAAIQVSITLLILHLPATHIIIPSVGFESLSLSLKQSHDLSVLSLEVES